MKGRLDVDPAKRCKWEGVCGGVDKEKDSSWGGENVEGDSNDW